MEAGLYHNKRERIGDAILALSEIGYVHEGNLGILDREAFAYEGKEHLQILLQRRIMICP